MAYSDRALRRTFKPRSSGQRSTGRAELVYLFIVLFAGVMTAWWAAHKVGPDLSIISTAASLAGFGETSATAPTVGYTGRADVAQPADAPAASHTQNFCTSGDAPTYGADFTALAQVVGDQMGTPVECAHTAASGGDTIQTTTTGLAAYDPTTQTASFTDGWRHWEITPQGVVTWEGTDPNPPTG